MNLKLKAKLRARKLAVVRRDRSMVEQEFKALMALPENKQWLQKSQIENRLRHDEGHFIGRGVGHEGCR